MSVTKIANDLAMMGSGPRAGIGELLLPELQKGSSIMPGKVNPVIPEVVMQVGRAGDRQRHGDHRRRPAGNFELNVRVPLIARNLLESIQLLTAKSLLFAEKCVEGIEANEEGCGRSAELTLAVATALNPFIGYDKATEIVKDAAASGRTLREVAIEHGVDEATLDKALDLRKIAAGNRGDGLPRRHAVTVSFSTSRRKGMTHRTVRVVQAFVTVGLWFGRSPHPPVEDARVVHAARGLCRAGHAGPVQQGRVR